MAAVLESDCVSDWQSRPVLIEREGRHTRGATLVDWQRRSGAHDNVRIAMRFDQARFEALVRQALGVR